MSTTAVLLVPIHLDGLYLANDHAVLETMANFSRMPYFDGQRDINPDVANISEEILFQPFQDRNLYLKAGMHLHWALPDALHHGIQRKTKIDFVPVPNRWLVTRTDRAGTKQWVVESNYLQPPNDTSESSGVSYPYQDSSYPEPSRFLGRKVAKGGWSEPDPQSDNPSYLHDLTAVGYGEPTFAAFYPNCHSVFGFHDGDIANSAFTDLKDVQYDVIGWYNEAGKECISSKIFLDALRSVKAKYNASEASIEHRFEALTEAFGWTVADSESVVEFPQHTIYYAQLTIAADTVRDPLLEKPEALIAVGNTTTEALSAHLAHTLEGDAAVLEDQLESLHLMPELEGQQLDTGAQFKEARHEKGFRSVSAGTIWTIRPKTTAYGPVKARDTPLQEQITLPDELASQLNRLNQRQKFHDRAVHELDSLRRQLFADWYKYMLSAYPPEDSRDDYPDMDEVRFFVERQTLRAVRQQQTENGELAQARDTALEDVRTAIPRIQRLFISDIRNWERFIGRLSQRRPLSETALTSTVEKIWQALPAERQAQLASQSGPLTDGEKTAILNELNKKVLELPQFFRDHVFPAAVLPREARREGEPIVYGLRFNRLIFEACFPQEIVRRPEHVLDQIPAPRYWQPCDPAVLIAHDNIKPTPRHGQDGRLRADGLLDCHLLTLEDFSGLPADHLDTLRSTVASLKPAENEEKIGFTRWQEQPWHPFLLEWTVEVFPVRNQGNLDSHQRSYAAGFLGDNYQFPEDSVDFVLRNPQTSLTRAANIYNGRTILTDFANLQLIDCIDAYVKKRVVCLYYDAKKLAVEQRNNDPPLDEVIAWADDQPPDKLGAFTRSVLKIYRHLKESDAPPLAQSLGGFNQALLQHKQTLQLPIADPLGFADSQTLTDAVREAVQRSNISAPQPLNDFNPIRSGAMRLIRLRLVDTFGRVQALLTEDSSEQVVVATTLGMTRHPHIRLPPRFSQPARLNFRWLSANHGTAEAEDEMEMNSHPATSPICGWVVPNFLDNSLLVFDQDGQALGAILKQSGEVRWQPAPGQALRLALEGVQNPHLQRFAAYLLTQNQNFFDDFLTAIESALENIDPENAAQHDALALLMGRPLAIVRARLGLELQGLPAINQDWNVFRQDMRRNARDADHFTAVQVPIRLGEHFRLNDGLVGFLVEQERNYSDNKFYAPQTPPSVATQSIDHPDIVVHRGTEQPHLLQAVDTPPRTLTMLVDPRASVNATTGILPTKSIRIPPDQYMAALRKIEVTFLTAPILTNRQTVELPVPTEAGYQWSWLAKENGVWSETSAIKPVDYEATFAAPHRLREGWLKLTPHRNEDDTETNNSGA